jgi:hypothetical protein
MGVERAAASMSVDSNYFYCFLLFAGLSHVLAGLEKSRLGISTVFWHGSFVY